MATDRQDTDPPDRRDESALGMHTCCRIGMRATPPGVRLRLGGWLRRG